MGDDKAAAADSERGLFLPGTARPLAPPAPVPADMPEQRPQLPAFIAFWRGFPTAISRDAARGGTFLCLPVLLGAGAAAYFALPWEPEALPLVLSLCLLLAVTFLSRDRRILPFISGAVLLILAGALLGKLETWRSSTPMMGSDVTTRITGRLVSLEHQASGRLRLTIDIVATERPQLRYPPARVRLSARAVPEGLAAGDGITGLASLMSPSGPVRPGAYDFSFSSYFNGIGAVGFFLSNPERAAVAADDGVTAGPARWLQAAREGLAARIRHAVPGAEGQVAVAMIVGMRAGIPEPINEWLRRSGLAHILAISGLHMALVAATVMAMARAGAALFPQFAQRVPVKKYAAGAALAFCTLYLFFSGSAVAAQRSYIMLAVMLAALLFDRAAITMRNLAIAALIIIIISPHEVVGPSFQMSFAATAALIAAYAGWTDWRMGRRERGRVPPAGLARNLLRTALVFAAGLAATSVIAGLATTLFGAWHFQRASPLALPANLAAMPLVSLVAMPAAVLAIFAMPFGLDGFFLSIMGRAIAAVIAIAEWISDRSPIDAVGLMPLPAFLLLTVAFVVAVLSTTRARLLAAPLAVVGFGLLVARELPAVLISEDGRLMGVRTADGGLAVNRARPNGFTMDDWTRALNAKMVVKPLVAGKTAAPEMKSRQFSCVNGLCLIDNPAGHLIAHAENAAAAKPVCETASLIVVDDATASNLCPGSKALVFTKRDLALRGSAAVWLAGPGEARTEFAQAISQPYRPWHTQRQYWRAARGLPPYRRKTGQDQ